jgi:hypothetical protein
MRQKKDKQTDPITQAAIETTEMEKTIEDQQALAVIEEHKSLIAPYTDGLPYNKDRVIVMAKQCITDSMESVVKAGKYLIWLQHEEDDLTFKHILNEHFPEVSRPTAYNFMRIAKTVAEHPKLQNHAKHYTKVIALLENLFDDDIGALESGEKIAGITLDEIDTTPRSQLVVQLKAHKAELNEQKKASERVQKLLHNSVDKAERELKKYKVLLAEMDLPENEATFIKNCEALRLSFDGYLLLLDPEHIADLEFNREEGIRPSARVRATYISLLQYMKMEINHACSLAEDYFGDARMCPEDSWFNSPEFKEKYGDRMAAGVGDLTGSKNN